MPIVPSQVLAVDWSGAKKQPRIWSAIVRVHDATVVVLQRHPTRENLIEHVVRVTDANPNTVVGLDFAFSAPRWFVEQCGADRAQEFWTSVALHADEWLRCPFPFWGRAAHPLRWPNIPEELRSTERRLKPRPSSIFQLIGARQVGQGSLRGMPFLTALRDRGHAIWPFDDPRLPLVVEIWPTILQKAVPTDRGGFLDALSSEVDVGAARNSEDAYDALSSAVVMARATAATFHLPPLDDDAAIEGQIWAAA